MRQARSEARKQAKIKRHEKAVELQMALEDRAAARSVQQELAELHRGSIRWAARLKVQVQPERPETRTSPVTKRIIGTPVRAPANVPGAPRPASSWVIDALGMKGVIWQQSYLGRKSPGFHHGTARENWEYIVRDEAVLLDAVGEPIIISNMGDDWIEIGAAWQAMEDASTRANAKIQMLAIAPFDSDMSEAEMIAALSHFCTTVLDPLGLPYSAAIHAPPEHGDERNYHPHIAFSLRPMRRIEPYCWEVADEVCGELDGRDGVQMLRHLWAHSMSAAAEEARSPRRYTGLGYGARKLGLETGEHLGEGLSAIVARGGHVWAHERNRIRQARNAARRAIGDADRKIAALTKIRDAAIERIERRIDVTNPPKIFRAVPPVGIAEVLSRTTVSQPVAMLTASAATVSAKEFVSARTDENPRQIFKASTPPVTATVVVASKTVAPANVRAPTTAPGHRAKRPAASRAATRAVRLRVVDPVRPAGIFTPAVAARPCARPVAATPVVAVARTFRTQQPVRPSVAFSIDKPIITTPGADPGRALFDALAIARAARNRKRRRLMNFDDLRLDALPELDGLATLDTLPTLDRLVAEAMPRDPVGANRLGDEDRPRVARLVTIDAYVADYGGPDRQVETDYPALKAIGVGWDWLKVPGVQAALRVARDEQQDIVAALKREASERPLAFSKTGVRFWPRDLAADHLRRLDRWAADPGFQHDMFQLQQGISSAHVEYDAKRTKARDTAADIATSALPSVPDGFGGWRQGPAPAFHDDGIRARIAAFDPVSGKPTDQLLMLLMLAGQNPHRIEVASDGRLMALPGKPAMLAPLLHAWRGDNTISALVTETVRASRDAGSPVWPASIAAVVHTYAARTSGTAAPAASRPPPDLGRGPAR